MRVLICLLIMLLLPLQSLAMQTGNLRVLSGGGASHQLDHIAGIEHHHHESDGAVHYDDSEESAQHSMEHSAASPFLFLGSLPPLLAEIEAVRETSAPYAAFVPQPILDDPTPPPVSTPGFAAGGDRTAV